MPELWVVNASPLILLAKIDHLHLLHALADQVIIPQAVADEVVAGPLDDPARIMLATPLFPLIAVALDPMIVAWDLGAGESAVLSYAVTIMSFAGRSVQSAANPGGKASQRSTGRWR